MKIKKEGINDILVKIHQDIPVEEIESTPTVENISESLSNDKFSASSERFASLSADKAFDNNNDTFWQADSVNRNSWIAIDFTTDKLITSLDYLLPTMQSSTCCLQTAAGTIRLENSLDGINWNIVETTYLQGLAGQKSTFNVTEITESKRYWRIYMVNNRGSVALRAYEINIFGY
jgi:hypothetical protein